MENLLCIKKVEFYLKERTHSLFLSFFLIPHEDDLPPAPQPNDESGPSKKNEPKREKKRAFTVFYRRCCRFICTEKLS